MVTDHRGHGRTLLPVQEIDLKACALVNLNQIIRPDRDSNPGPTGNPLKYSEHCATKPQGQTGKQTDKHLDAMTFEL